MSVTIVGKTPSVTLTSNNNTVSISSKNNSVNISSKNNLVSLSPIKSMATFSAKGPISEVNIRDWVYYVFRVEYTGVVNSIESGDVLTATLDGITIYRFINNTNNVNGYPIEDSFYNNFDGNDVTDILARRNA